MKDVPSGTYTVNYFKEGYNNYKQFSVQHVGGSVSTFPYLDNDLTLITLTPTKVLTFAYDRKVDNYAYFKGTINMTSGAVIVFMNNQGEASPTNYNRISAVLAQIDKKGNFEFFINLSTISTSGYKSGDVVSFKAYGSRVTDLTDDTYRYYDPTLDLYIYPNISAEGVEVKYTIP